jgi:peptidoglycan/LPS O-acetylase OafA/YrhL
MSSLLVREKEEKPRPKRDDIQGLRAIAVISVVAFHAGLINRGGFTGVDVFFVISGFVICGTLVREVTNTGRINLTSFYARRIRRLLPALSLTVIVALLIDIYLLNPYQQQATVAKTGIAAMLGLANIAIYRQTGSYFGVDALSNPLLHTWSLSVEEQFYFIFPALLSLAWLGYRHQRTQENAYFARKISFLVIGLLALASFALCVAMVDANIPILGIRAVEAFAFYSPFTRAWEFALGCLAFLALETKLKTRIQYRLAFTLSILGIVFIVTSNFYLRPEINFPGYIALLPCLGAVLLLLAGSLRNPISCMLSSRGLQRIGDVSYSWYLWHWPVLVLATALWPLNSWALILAGASSYLPAWLSYKYLENPLRFGLSFKSKKATIRLAAIAIALPIALASYSLNMPLPNGLGNVPKPPQASWDLDACVNATTYERALVTCQFRLPASKAAGKALLIGDSHAAALTRGFVAAAHANQLDAFSSTLPGCPIVPEGAKPRECDAYYAHIKSWIGLNKPEIVVIQNRSAHYTNSPVLVYDELRQLVRQPCLQAYPGCAGGGEAVEIWAESLASQVGKIRKSGAKVLVVLDTPEQRVHGPEATSRLLGVRVDGTSRAEVNARRDAVTRAEKSVIGRSSGSAVIDPIEFFCSKDLCPVKNTTGFLYVDDDHISTIGTSLLEAPIAAEMQRLLKQ